MFVKSEMNYLNIAAKAHYDKAKDNAARVPRPSEHPPGLIGEALPAKDQAHGEDRQGLGGLYEMYLMITAAGEMSTQN